MNTCIAIAIGLRLGISNLGIKRIGTHCIECFFGYVRIACHFNHTAENVIRAAKKAIILNKYMKELNVKFKIRSRDNVGGIHLHDGIYESDEEILSEDRAYVMKSLTIMNEINQDYISSFIGDINSYTKRLVKEGKYGLIKLSDVTAGRGPINRINALRYRMSVSPARTQSISNDSNPLKFYSKQKSIHTLIRDYSYSEWSQAIINTICNDPDLPKSKKTPEQTKNRKLLNKENQENISCDSSLFPCKVQSIDTNATINTTLWGANDDKMKRMPLSFLK